MDIAPYWQNYVDGAWINGGAGRLTIEDPATGAPLAEQALADASDVNRTVAAARRCFESGALTSMRPCERGRMVRRMGDWLLDQTEEIASLLTLESGKPLWEARIEIEGAARYFEYYGNQAETLEGQSIPLGADYLDFTICEPYGISVHIIPWNYPLEMAARSLSAALTAGNACIVKTPELDPLSSNFLAKAADAVGLPPGAVNVICGLGQEAGAALTAHPDVNQIVFTGSVETGTRVACAAAMNVVPCVLELGGKSAAIVYSDADLDMVMDSVRWGIFFNAGQVCSALSRAIVHESIHDDLVERAAALAKSLSVGPGIERPELGTNMGSMISEKQRDRAEAMCARAEGAGARAAAGGRKPNRPGWFLEPTIFDRVEPGSELGQTEVFGPVLSVMKFSTDDEALAIANGTQYGLVGGVFTTDVDRAMRAAQRIRAGQIYVNEWYAGGVETPFGGYGKSGYGREKGREALRNYVQTKNVAIRLRK